MTEKQIIKFLCKTKSFSLLRLMFPLRLYNFRHLPQKKRRQKFYDFVLVNSKPIGDHCAYGAAAK